MCCKCAEMDDPTKRDQFKCLDCGADTSKHGIQEWYMVTQRMWDKVAKDGDVLCIGCLEKRLGKVLGGEGQLRAAAFEGYPINYDGIFPQSERLQSRIRGDNDMDPKVIEVGSLAEALQMIQTLIGEDDAHTVH